MTISLTMLQADIDFMIADLPTAVTANSETHNCVVSDITSQDDLDMAGIIEGNGFVVVITLDDWTTVPDTGKRVTIGGKNFRVIQTSDSPDGLARTLTCGGDLQ